MWKSILILFAVCLIIIMMSGTASAQCAMCQAAVKSSDEGMQLARGLNNGILYLLIIPYLIVFGFAASIYFKVKKNGKNFRFLQAQKLISGIFDERYQQ